MVMNGENNLCASSESLWGSMRLDKLKALLDLICGERKRRQWEVIIQRTPPNLRRKP
jgi:hypothetical protein